MNVFVSYSSKDRDRVRDLVRDLEEVGHNVWFDQELSGGQDWWDRILNQIRSCDVFVIALSENWVLSGPCAQECNYALALDRHVLPASIKELKPETMPATIQRLQIVNYQQSDMATLKKLMLALNQLPPSTPLPDPLPEPPPVPLSPLALLANQLQAATLSLAEQRDILTRLRLSLQEAPGDREPLVLLERLIQHPDCGNDLITEAQTLYETFQPRKAAPVSSIFPRLTPARAPQMARLGKLSYFVGGDLTGGVTVWSRTSTFSTDGQLLALSYTEHHRPLGEDFRKPLDVLFDNYPTGQNKGRILIYDTVSHKMLSKFKCPNETTANLLSFSPDRRLLAAGYRDDIGIWDITLRRMVHTLPLPDGTHPRAVTFSPDGKLLAIQTAHDKAGNRLHLWDTRTWERRVDVNITASVEKEGARPAFYFLPDGHRLLMLVKGELHEVNLHTFDSQLFAHSVDVPLHGLWAAAPGGYPVLYAGKKQKRLLTYQLDPWQLHSEFVLNFEGTEKYTAIPFPKTKTVKRTVDELAISPGGDLLAIITDTDTSGFVRNATTITLWDLHRLKPVSTLTTYLNVDWLAFSPDGGLLAVCSGDKAVELWGIPRTE